MHMIFGICGLVFIYLPFMFSGSGKESKCLQQISTEEEMWKKKVKEGHN